MRLKSRRTSQRNSRTCTASSQESPRASLIGHNHVRMGEQLQHLGHVARVDLRAGRKDQDPVAPGVLESAAQGRPLAVPPAQHDQREGFAGLLERHQPGQSLARLPTEHIEKLDLILCRDRRRPGTHDAPRPDRLVTQHRDNHRDDMECSPLAGRRSRRPRRTFGYQAHEPPFVQVHAGAAASPALTGRRPRAAAWAATAPADHRHTATPANLLHLRTPETAPTSQPGPPQWRIPRKTA